MEATAKLHTSYFAKPRSNMATSYSSSQYLPGREISLKRDQPRIRFLIVCYRYHQLFGFVDRTRFLDRVTSHTQG
jgi:hypothetical protein